MGNNLLVVLLLVVSVSTIDLSAASTLTTQVAAGHSLFYYVDIGAGVAVIGALRTGNFVALLRVPDVLARVGFGRALLYNEIRDGRFVRPVKLTARSSAWPSNEVDAIVAAHIRGVTDAQLKELVRELEAARKTAGIEAA